MVTYISSWARQIIVAVIVAVILEMILSPNSKSTKYIKTVIGVYVMYAIISPGLKLINKNSLDFSNIDYEEYFTNSDIYRNMEMNIDEVENDYFNESYELNLKQSIENKLNEMGFVVSNIKMEIEFDKESEEYGEIKSIKIGLSKKTTKSEKIVVNKIEVGENSQKENGVSDEDKSVIKDFLKQEYGINYDNIVIV